MILKNIIFYCFNIISFIIFINKFFNYTYKRIFKFIIPLTVIPLVSIFIILKFNILYLLILLHVLLLITSYFINKTISINELLLSCLIYFPFILVNAFSKIISSIFFISILFIISILKTIKNNITVVKWHPLIVIQAFLFIFFLYIISEVIRSSFVSIVAIIWFIILLSIISFIVFFKYDELIQENIKMIKKEQKQQYKLQSYKSLTDAKSEIEAICHRLSYIIMSIENEIDPNNIKLKQDLNKFMISINEQSQFIDTGNVIFDFNISNKLRNSYTNNNSMKSIISISHNDFYDSSEFVELINYLINYFKNCASTELTIIEKVNYIIINFSFENNIDNTYIINLLQEKYQSIFDLTIKEYTDSSNRYNFKVIAKLKLFNHEK